MKFGRDLAHKAVPEWSNGYVNYSLLKKKVKAIAKQFPLQELNLHPSRLANRGESEVNVGLAVSSAEASQRRCQEIERSMLEAEFMAALNVEVEKINLFFDKQMKVVHNVRRKLDLQLLGFYADHAPPAQAEMALTIIRDRLERDQHRHDSLLSVNRSNLVGEQETHIRRRGGEVSSLQRDTKLLSEAYKEFYRLLDLLVSFQELNRVGFVKILKKHDKITGLTLSSSFLAKVRV